MLPKLVRGHRQRDERVPAHGTLVDRGESRAVDAAPGEQPAQGQRQRGHGHSTEHERTPDARNRQTIEFHERKRVDHQRRDQDMVSHGLEASPCPILDEAGLPRRKSGEDDEKDGDKAGQECGHVRLAMSPTYARSQPASQLRSARSRPAPGAKAAGQGLVADGR
ncbi:MAG: hypothetical protein NTW00_15455 [Hyphomicrobiales bacterium]|nr:hypothetical protein [Hyphomicrobiales bacterium]